MKQKLLRAITSAMLIITMTMANFLFLCVNVVSYAADAVNIDKTTSHKNIEFMTYFKDEKGDKVLENGTIINNNELLLYFNVAVKKEGYFNGKIVLNNSNFKFKTDIIHEAISKIENNVIYLNQINAGESREISVGIEVLREEQFDLNLLNCDSEVSIEGIYRDRKQKDISVNAKKEVSLILVSPDFENSENVILSQEIITNRILNVEGEKKRILQVMVTSGIKDNLFPVKKTVINIPAPRSGNGYLETILVDSNDVLVTNGEYFSDDNWNYDRENGIVQITVENKQKNGKVFWKNEGTDKFIITYVFYEDSSMNYRKAKVSSEIELYDTNKTVLKKDNQISLNEEKIDSVVTSKIEQSETSIYKGKLNVDGTREINYKNVLDINLDIDGLVDIVNLIERRQMLGNKYLRSVYKTTKINKMTLDKILGEKGKIQIVDIGREDAIFEINKDTKANREGDIVLTYPENVQTIQIKVISPESNGRLEFETTKIIKDVNSTILEGQNKINMEYDLSYTSNNMGIGFAAKQSTIDLKETETSVNLEVNRNQLSAMFPNDNVEFRITLNSKEEKHKLFKNPVLKLQLPEKIENIEVNSIKLLYEDQLTIKSAVLNNKTIEIVLEGEQTKYKEEAVEGAIILINANLKTIKRIPSSTEKIKLTYTNSGVRGNVEKNINIVSYAGVVTTNQISEYGIEIINNEGNEIGNLEFLQSTKNATVQKKIINNKENKISNVKILGTFPTKDAIASNNIDIEVGNILIAGIDANRVKIYYSNNQNATEDLENKNNNWVEDIEDSKLVKKYLVVVNELELLEEIDLVYQITIPSNLDYNQGASEGYTVFYNNMTTEEKITTKFIKLETPAGTVVETSLKALVAGKESNTVKENGILRYEITVVNTGSEDVSNLKINAKVPEGTTFVNTQNLNNEVDIDNVVFTDESKKELEFTIEKLNKGQQITKYYEVQVNNNMAGKKVVNSITLKYGEVTKQSNEVSTLIEAGKLELKLVSMDAINNVVKSGYQYRYILYVTNQTSKDIRNIKAKINTSDVLDISKIYYIDSNDKANIVNNTNSIEIAKIKQGETIQVAINTTVEIFKNTISKNATISASIDYDNSNYKSNQIDLIAKSDLLYDLNVTSENSGSYVKAGETIKYNVKIKNQGESTKQLTLNNWISNDVTLVKVIHNGVELAIEDYSLKVDNSKEQKVLKILNDSLKPGETAEYQVEVVVNLLYGNTEAIEIVSEYSLDVDAYEIATAKIMHVLEPEQDDTSEEKPDENLPDGGQPGEDKPDDSNPDSSEPDEYRIIYGVAWLDENENGQKDMSEKAIEGIDVKLLDVLTNEFVKDANGNVITTKTTQTGFYNFSEVIKGQYIVVFEYDTTQYWLTSFEKEGVLNEVNSNVITKTINIDGIEKQIAATEVIVVDNSNVSNVNIGLILAKKHDLQLDKYISKVTIQNNKTESFEYTDAVLVKQEIDAKQINSTTIVVEYIIKVTNAGDVAAYAKKIADYLPSDYKFNSELNKDWYQSGDNLYCTTLANEAIQPGESKEVKLTVIKEMTEDNIGLINNTAEIESSYNELGLTDIDSIDGNKAKGEDDMGTADLIISIRTGQVVMTVSLIISSIIILGVAIVLLKRMIRI